MTNTELQESLKQSLLEYESKNPGNGLLMIGTSSNKEKTEVSVITNYPDADSVLTLLVHCMAQIPQDTLSTKLADFVKLIIKNNPIKE